MKMARKYYREMLNNSVKDLSGFKGFTENLSMKHAKPVSKFYKFIDRILPFKIKITLIRKIKCKNCWAPLYKS